MEVRFRIRDIVNTTTANACILDAEHDKALIGKEITVVDMTGCFDEMKPSDIGWANEITMDGTNFFWSIHSLEIERNAGDFHEQSCCWQLQIGSQRD